MYAFSLKPTGRRVDPDAAPPPPAHTILAPSELPTQQHTTATTTAEDERQQPGRASSDDTTASFGKLQQLSTSAAAAHSKRSSPTPGDGGVSSHPPLHVYNVGAYTDMRDAADWSAAVQRERAEKRLRALAAHDAAKAEEQRRRAAAEAQNAREVLRRHEERQQLRAARKEEEVMASFQDRNTDFLRDQQRLMDLGASLAHADQQRKARVRDEVYKAWCSSSAGVTAALCNTGGYTSAPSATSTATVRGLPILSVSPSSTWATTTINTAMAAPVASTTAPAREGELRQAAQSTEDAYVRLSLAYRNEAQRSRAAADILASAQRSTNTSAAVTSTGNNSSRARSHVFGSHGQLATNTSASVAPLPFRTAPAMYSHDSPAHMGEYAHEIPTTYIPEYFDDGSGPTSKVYTTTNRSTLRATAPVQNGANGGSSSSGGSEEVMPLPLHPPPVSAEVSEGLRDAYYPWAALANPSTAAVKPRHPQRDAYLPVQKWGPADLQASIYGHGANPDGTMQASCERRKDCAAELNYTTIPIDNATATTNTPEAVPPIRPGKRQEVWL